MFSQDDFSCFDSDYFQIIECKPASIIVKSKCTRHTWLLVPYKDPKGNLYVEIFHKHKDNDQFHWQTIEVDVSSAVDSIKGHDAFHKNRRRCPYDVYTREGIVRNGRLKRY